MTRAPSLPIRAFEALGEGCTREQLRDRLGITDRALERLMPELERRGLVHFDGARLRPGPPPSMLAALRRGKAARGRALPPGDWAGRGLVAHGWAERTPAGFRLTNAGLRVLRTLGER